MNLKRILLLVAVIALLVFAGFRLKRKFYDAPHRLEIATQQVQDLEKEYKLRDGDIIFQTSLSAQSQAIQLATHSDYSHCGLIFKTDSGYMVLEAVQPVKETPLNKWVARGQGAHFVIKRLKDADKYLTPDTLAKMKQVGELCMGKDYDSYFEWSDRKMYCSELIWKVYQRSTGLRVGQLQKLSDFDLNNPIVKAKLKERYSEFIPMEQIVISPVSIFNSELLETIVAK